MPTHLELCLLTRVITDSDFHSIEKARIDENYFTTSEAREVFRYLWDVYHAPNTAGLIPSLDMVQHRFHGFYPAHAPDPVPLLCEQLRVERIRNELLTLSQELSVEAQTDPLSAMTKLRARSSELSSLGEAGEDMSLSNAYGYMWNRYQTVAATGGMMGIPYPWTPLNLETQGMQGSQFIVLYGRPKSMKSWIGIYMGCHAYMHSRRRVLFYTREMHPSLVIQRAVSCIARVDYKAFKNATLQPELRDRTFTIMQQLAQDEQAMSVYENKKNPYFIVTTDRSGGTKSGGGVGWLEAKIRELEPDLVIVDGMYLMRDDRDNKRSVDWKNIANISQDLKLTAQNFNIPLIGITQANRAADKSKGEDLTELAYSDSLGQDADAVFRVSKKEIVENNDKKTFLYFTAPGLREGKFEGIVLNANPGFDFGYVRTIVDQAEAADDTSYGGHKSKLQSSFKPLNPRTPYVP